MTDASQGSTIERINLTITSAPLITHLPQNKFVATIVGTDQDGESRTARFNAPKGADSENVQKRLDEAFSKGSIELEGIWVTRRFKSGDATRNAVEFSVSDLDPKPIAQGKEGASQAASQDATPAKRPATKSIAILATKAEVDAALEQITTGRVTKDSPPVTKALVLYREALEQPLYEPIGNGRHRGTGKFALAEEALKSLSEDFGTYGQRNVYINETKAADIIARMTLDDAERLAKDENAPQRAAGQKKILDDAITATQERRAIARTAPAQAEQGAEPKSAPANEATQVAAPAKSATPPAQEHRPAADPKKAASIAHQADPMLLTASLAEIKAALTSKATLSSPVAQTLKTFAEAIKQPEWRKRADGKGNEKTGVFFNGEDGLRDLIKNFGSQTFRNVYVDKEKATDVLMRMDDTTKVNDAMAAALEKSKERRIQMNAAKAAERPKVKQRERDRD